LFRLPQVRGLLVETVRDDGLFTLLQAQVGRIVVRGTPVPDAVVVGILDEMVLPLLTDVQAAPADCPRPG
jgi:hypothetical protein